MYISLGKNVVAKYNLFCASDIVEFYNSKLRGREEPNKLVPSLISKEVPISFSLPPVLITINMTMFTPNRE